MSSTLGAAKVPPEGGRVTDGVVRAEGATPGWKAAREIPLEVSSEELVPDGAETADGSEVPLGAGTVIACCGGGSAMVSGRYWP
jgi:hypothetical protein